MPGTHEPVLTPWRQRLVDFGQAELTRHVLAPFLVQRSLLFALMPLAALLIPSPGGWQALPTQPLLDPWLRWDSAYFLIIAARGYGPSPWGDPAAFFPLYPGAISLLGVVMPRTVAALVVANGCALGMLLLLYELGKEIADASVARRAVWMTLIFPTSFFLSAGYAESIYTLALVATTLAWVRRRFGVATLGVLAATLASPSGVLCATVPFLFGWLLRRDRWRSVPWFIIGAVPGAALLLLVHDWTSGDPFAFLHPIPSAPLVPQGAQVQQMLLPDGTTVELTWMDVLRHAGLSLHSMRMLLNWSAILLLGASTLHLLRRRAWELAAIVALTLVVPILLQGMIMQASSLARHTLGAFPIFFVLARWAPDGLRARVLDSGLVMLQALLAALFAAWYWAA